MAAQTIVPVLFGALPFGLVVGIVSAENNLTTLQTLVQTTAIFAGASQLVMLDLLGNEAALWVIFISTGILNLRHVIYSAALSPHYKHLSTAWKALLSFVMVDQVYALSNAHIENSPDEKNLHWYHMGLATPIILIWTSATLCGYALGPIIPESWGLSFVIPLMFLALLVPAIKNRAYLAAALVSTVIALAAHSLPNNLGMIAATFGAITVGLLLDRSA